MQVQSRKLTSERILASATRLFAAKGYSNVSIRDVCRESGISAPVIYYYFGSKKGLFEAVIGKRVSMAGFIEKLSKTSKEKEADPGLRSFVWTYLTLFPDNAFEPGLYMRDSASLDSESARKISEDLDRIQSIASNIIARGIRGGNFRKSDPDLAAECLLGMLNKVIFQRIHFAKPSDREAYGRFVIDFFERAMKPSAPS